MKVTDMRVSSLVLRCTPNNEDLKKYFDGHLRIRLWPYSQMQRGTALERKHRTSRLADSAHDF